MGKAATLSSRDAQYKAQAQSYLAEARRILRSLSAEREKLLLRLQHEVAKLKELPPPRGRKSG